VLADVLVPSQSGEDAHQRHGGRDLAVLRALEQCAEGFERRDQERRRAVAARRQIAAERDAARLQVAHLLAVGRRLAEREAGDLLVGDRDIEAVANRLEILLAQLLLLVRDVQPFRRLAEPESLHGLREDDGGCALVGHRGCVRGVDLLRIVAAAVQAPDLLIGHVGDHLLELGVLAEEMLARVRAALGFEVLILPIDALFHQTLEQSLLIVREQGIPARSPQHLDHVPAGAEEGRLELLDDFAIAAYRSVQALQIAVDHEDEVIEPFAHRHGERAHRLRFVHLTVAQKRPDFPIRRRGDPAMLQIAHEPRLKDRHHRAQTHRHRRELPEIRHEPRMRI
jgi:hypothetical protein